MPWIGRLPARVDAPYISLSAAGPRNFSWHAKAGSWQEASDRAEAAAVKESME